MEEIRTLDPFLFPNLLDVELGVPWIGPCEILDPTNQTWQLGTIYATSKGVRRVFVLSSGHDLVARLHDVRLPLDRPEALVQVARVLGDERACMTCGGDGDDKGVALRAARGPGGLAGVNLPCPTCRGQGRLQTPIWHLIPKAHGGSLDETFVAHAPTLAGLSALRVAAKLPPILEVAFPWEVRRDTSVRYRVQRLGMRTGNLLAKVESPGFFHEGWEVLVADAKVPRGDTLRVKGQNDADDSLLAEGIALAYHDGRMRFPMPPKAAA